MRFWAMTFATLVLEKTILRVEEEEIVILILEQKGELRLGEIPQF